MPVPPTGTSPRDCTHAAGGMGSSRPQDGWEGVPGAVLVPWSVVQPDATLLADLMSLSAVTVIPRTLCGRAQHVLLRSCMDTGGFLLIAISGVGVVALSYALDRVWAAATPVRALYLFLRFPGIVLHECAHIAGCLLTGAKIRHVVLFSREGGSVTCARPALPVIGDVIISTAPLFLLPLALAFIAGIFSQYLGCTFPQFPDTLDSI